jgi:hypothetical protein
VAERADRQDLRAIPWLWQAYADAAESIDSEEPNDDDEESDEGDTDFDLDLKDSLITSVRDHLKLRVRTSTFEEDCMGGSTWYHYLATQPRGARAELVEILRLLRDKLGLLIAEWGTDHPDVDLSMTRPSETDDETVGGRRG